MSYKGRYIAKTLKNTEAIPEQLSIVLYGSANSWYTVIPMNLLLNGAAKKSLYPIYLLGMEEYIDIFQIFILR